MGQFITQAAYCDSLDEYCIDRIMATIKGFCILLMACSVRTRETMGFYRHFPFICCAEIMLLSCVMQYMQKEITEDSDWLQHLLNDVHDVISLETEWPQGRAQFFFSFCNSPGQKRIFKKSQKTPLITLLTVY